MNEIDKCIELLNTWTRKLEEFRLGGWLRMEPSVLPKWKRRPKGFQTLPSGELVVVGKAHSVRTRYMRSQFNAGDVAYLGRVVRASQATTAEQATTILRRMKPDTSRAKRLPGEAEPDMMDTTWRSRPGRSLSAEDLIREQFTHNPKQLARELARLRR